MALAHSPRIVTNGLVLYLDAGNIKSYPGSGTTWTDISGNDNGGTLINEPTYDSANGGSIVFDGIDDYVDLGINRKLDNILLGGRNWSISYWIKYTIDGRILDNGNIGTDPAGTLELNTTAITANNLGTSSSLSASLISSDWNCITLTKNSSTLHSWYLNGTFSNSSTPANDYITGGNTWKIGRRAFSTSAMYGGNLAQLCIYGRVLTAAEVQQNFNALRGRYRI